MKILRVFPALILALGLAGLPAYAADAPKGGVEAKPTETVGRLSRREIIKRLQLTDDQHKMLKQNQHSYRSAMVKLESQIKIQQVELENELDKPEPDQTKLDTLTQQIGELYGKKLAEKVKAKLDLERKILTPQQLDLLRTLQGKDGTDESL
ncbi:MAG TPA: hypothetical protein VMV05_08220 [bacterium]|nr:hypothetical protein [bacterium]